ncbi:amidase domain-containing protein [Ruminococcus albus]|uniref:von Willebrand factor type A n=1 Tax=Ruminococcus albus (strain ATCC 27210 / DSM 20455 / JCM 14654 / NCDO 2250 / 7) TaxID=697329 RepID=E6UJK7_RUMA7|nr:amidase domain-containing protein [Ruminococcus albus]ADU23853.1 von Willebrand factor type A [Ruminococcus albus 7 = DSM 20455]
MDQKRSKNQKRIVSGLLSLAMITTSMSAVLPASADSASKQEAYPYAIFAADELGGIKLDLNYLTVNGNACTNGVYSTTAKYPNVNGTILENEALAVDEVVTDDENATDAQDSAKAFDISRDMIYIHNKLMTGWFNNGRNFDNDYTLSEMNINLNSPVYVTGKMSYNGNMALNTAIGAVSDVTLSGGNLNGNNAVIYSKFGDIKIDESQASMNGLIYAPFGTVTIDCDNFNLNGIIIAQNVVISSRYGANINYSNTWAEFVGTETEELSWTFADWKYLADTDKDGLPNIIEKEIGTKPYEADTDGDLLPDGYEVLSLGTDPLKIDTDNNGVSDYDEDYDEDGLSNGREYEIGTRPYADDTDGDNLKDGEEGDKYYTDPLEMDTDKDGLNDDDEIYFGTDPNDPDTDDDGELDGEERRSQTFTHKVENEDCAVTEVIVSMEGTGNLQKTAKIKSVMNKDKMCTDVVGLVGEPFSIKISSEYKKATLSFKIDQSKLGDTEFDNLMFLWYDEKKKEFVELDTFYDSENSIVSIETEHFSKYMVVDKTEWFNNWRKIYNSYAAIFSAIPSYTAICVDCSGSMSTNDKSFKDDNGVLTCYRNIAVQNYVESMFVFDNASIITFESSASEECEMTNNKRTLSGKASFYNRGGTNANSAIDIAIDELNHVYGKKNIILLSDGDVNVSDDNIKYCKNNGIRIHTVALGSGANSQLLKQYANDTGGTPLTATTAEGLTKIYESYAYNNMTDFREMEDSDGDGLPNDIEYISGIPLPNGKLVFTNPNKPDSDGDDLTDGQEVNESLYIQKIMVETFDEEFETINIFKFKPTSDPTDPDTDDDELDDYHELIAATNAFDDDTDDDGALDGRDKYPLNLSDTIYDRNAAYEYSQKYYNTFNSEYPRIDSDCANFVSQCVYAGGMQMNSLWYVKKNNLFDYITTVWGDRAQDLSLKWSLKWTDAEAQYKYFKETYSIAYYKINRGDSISDFVQNHLEIKVGDTLYFHNVHKPKKEVTHATIISKIDDSEIYYAGHSNPASMTPLSDKIMTPDEDTEDPNDYLYDYVYIVQMSDAL